MRRIFITTVDHGSAITLSIGGHIDGSTAPELDQAIRALIAEGRYRIVADLKELDFMSSAGLGILMSAIQQARENRGDVKLARANQSIRRLISVMGFDSIYQIHDTEESALADFAGSD